MKKRVHPGSTMLIFITFTIVATLSALLVFKSTIYLHDIRCERYIYEQNSAAARALLVYGIEWAQQEIDKNKKIAPLEWHGPWWPESKEWQGGLYISSTQEIVEVKATLNKQDSTLFTIMYRFNITP